MQYSSVAFYLRVRINRDRKTIAIQQHYLIFLQLYSIVSSMKITRRDRLYPLPPEGLEIVGISLNVSGRGEGTSTLSLGRRVVRGGFAPIAYAVVPGHEYEVGQVLRRYPDGAMTVSSVFRRR